jgi:hypothetical protein
MSYYPQQTQHPPLPPPWYAEWDQRDQRYVFINPQTGERTFQHPHPTYQPQGGYPPQGGYGGQAYPQQQTYGQQQGYQQAGYVQQSSPPPAPQPRDNHNALKYGALGAVGGLVAGGLAMHEADKIRKLSPPLTEAGGVFHLFNAEERILQTSWATRTFAD